MVFYVVADNILDCYAYLFKKERLSRPSLCLTTFCRLVKIGIKKLLKKLSETKISSTITKLNHLLNFNATECKLIMKEVNDNRIDNIKRKVRRKH